MTDVLAVGLMKMELVTCNASDDVNEGKNHLVSRYRPINIKILHEWNVPRNPLFKVIGLQFCGFERFKNGPLPFPLSLSM